MPEFTEEEFKRYWEKTEVIREYQRFLFTFGDMKLPYIFAAEHERFRDRAVVRKGVIFTRRPHIILPSYGPEFQEGFEHRMPPRVAYLFRAMGIPYSRVINKTVAKKVIEYGRLQSVLDNINRDLEKKEDAETGLIKGDIEGLEPSLMRYFVGLSIKSGPENLREFLEHKRRQMGEPMRPDEKITDDDIRRLLE